MVGGLAPWHIVIVILVVVILFGSKKLPDAARGLGRSMRIFKSEIKEMQTDGKAEEKDSPAITQGQPNAAQFVEPQVQPQQYVRPQDQPAQHVQPQPQQYVQPQPHPQQVTDPTAPHPGGQGQPRQ